MISHFVLGVTNNALAFTKENLSKAYRHLMSKGFDYETAKAALASLGADEEG